MSTCSNSIILIEDNIALSEALAHRLKDDGFLIRCVCDGNELNAQIVGLNASLMAGSIAAWSE
jgi:DNA-binding response OmpR family regulator